MTVSTSHYEDSNYESNTLDANNVVTKYDKNAAYTTVNITSENAIPAWDKTNGNLLKYNMYDYRVEILLVQVNSVNGTVTR